MRFHFNEVSEDPLIRFGLKNPTAVNFKKICCMFSAYRAVKAQVRSGRINLQQGNWKRNAWNVLASTIGAEAGEMYLPARSFSLPKFMSFLATGVLPRQHIQLEDPQ